MLLPALRGLGRGMEVVDPWSLGNPDQLLTIAAMPAGDERVHAWRGLNREIGERNRRAIDACDAVVAILDGVDVDSGTAAEIGYAFARGKRIAGYRGDFRLSGDNEGAAVNVQVEFFILASGGVIASSIDALASAFREA